MDGSSVLSRQAEDNPFRFEGFYYDSGVKTYDMHARQYRPDVGRFLTQDRFEAGAADLELQADPLTQNRYAFAGGNPVNRIEFDGHGACTSMPETSKYRQNADGKVHRNPECHCGDAGGGGNVPLGPSDPAPLPVVHTAQVETHRTGLPGIGEGALKQAGDEVTGLYEFAQEQWLNPIPLKERMMLAFIEDPGGFVGGFFDSAVGGCKSIDFGEKGGRCAFTAGSYLIPLTKIGTALKGTKAASTADTPDLPRHGGSASVGSRAVDDTLDHGYKYHPRIRQRGVEDPRAHNFPYSFDAVILRQKPVQQPDGSLVYRKPGSINGEDGVYEIALNPETRTIFHRTWRSR